MEKKICPMYPCEKCESISKLTGLPVKCPFKDKIKKQGNKLEAKNG